MSLLSTIEDMRRVQQERQSLRRNFLTKREILGDNTAPSVIWSAFTGECLRFDKKSPWYSPNMDVNLIYRDGLTPLMIAAWNNRVEYCENLLMKGADFTKVGHFYGSPMTAMMFAIGRDNYRVVKSLFEYGDDPNSLARVREHEFSLVAYAIDHQAYQTIPILIQYGADFNQSDIHELSPIHKVCLQIPEEKLSHRFTRDIDMQRDDVLSMLESLLSTHAVIRNRRECRGLTPLHLAAYTGCVQAVEMLVEAGESASFVDETKQLPSHYTRHPRVRLYLQECEG
ncbi:ankyrin repeat domain-containing protein 50-like [Corticium candelabrum]|uniref:ankyrin repeat domain-containing protein 50-like n=1 Tax=Corticium candelabrum TaxID=121492 RepID=UPI002E269E9A|nr:ankyrin repeat domain-containing protein 50-like [Corticium candelabrum]